MHNFLIFDFINIYYREYKRKILYCNIIYKTDTLSPQHNFTIMLSTLENLPKDILIYEIYEIYSKLDKLSVVILRHAFLKESEPLPKILDYNLQILVVEPSNHGLFEYFINLNALNIETIWISCSIAGNIELLQKYDHVKSFEKWQCVNLYLEIKDSNRPHKQFTEYLAKSDFTMTNRITLYNFMGSSGNWQFIEEYLQHCIMKGGEETFYKYLWMGITKGFNSDIPPYIINNINVNTVVPILFRKRNYRVVDTVQKTPRSRS